MDNLPPNRHLYDLFGGGGSVTCAALASGKYMHVHCNDINKHSLFLESCINDNVPGLFRWVSRSEYFEKRDVDDMAFFCYSFSSNGQDYIYNTEIEGYKKALYYARVFHDFGLLYALGINTRPATRRRILADRDAIKTKYIAHYMRDVLRMNGEPAAIFADLRRIVAKKNEYLRGYLCAALKESGLTQRRVGELLGTNMERRYFGASQFQFPTREAYAKMREFMPLPLEYDDVLQDSQININNLRALQNLERLTDFDSLQSHQNQLRIKELAKLKPVAHRATFSNLDYREVKVEPGSVIYCDIPYANSCGYEFNDHCGHFDHGAFYAWAAAQKDLVLISEYWMPAPDFIPVASLPLTCTFGGCRKDTREKIFIPRHQLGLWVKKMGRLF